jgi:hypothetical protein
MSPELEQLQEEYQELHDLLISNELIVEVIFKNYPLLKVEVTPINYSQEVIEELEEYWSEISHPDICFKIV